MSKNPPPGLCREELAASRSELSESNISCIPPDEALLGKVKSTMSDIVASFEASGTSTSFSVDDHIAATERHLNALKQLKMDRTASAGCSTPNAAFGTPPPASLSSPNSRPSTYIAAVLRPKKVSPKRSPFITRGEVEAARHTSALRSEERQRRAEERRLDYLQELKMKSSAADARVMQVKARREMAEQQRIIAQDRLQNGIRRAQEVLQQTKERAQHAHSHIDEVRLTNELRQQTKALLLDKKMNEVVHNREQKLEERQRLAQERKDAIMAAAERRRNLSQERLEKQQQREQQRQENIRRMEDQKRQDQEQKQRKADEWEKKVLQHYEDANAEAEALCQKTEMKFSKSAELLNKRRVMQQKKVQLQDQKFREAQQRRNGELDSKPAYQELLPPGTAIEEEQLSQRMSKTVAAAQRQGRIYCETYQKDCLRSVKDLNRCRLRLIFSRLATSLSGSGSVAQSIHALNEIKASSLTELDMEYLRYFNSYEVIVKAITESRKLRELTLFRQSAGLLRLLFSDSAEGRTNILHFSRCGNIVPLVQCLREELKTLKQHSNSDILRLLLFLIGKCLEGICAEASTNGSLQSTRDQVLSDLESFGMDRLCQVVVKLCTSEEDLELAHSALCVIHAQISVYARRKTEVKSSWFTSVSTSLFTLLQNVVTPDTGSPLREDAKSMSCGRVTVLFCVLRVLNMLARWQLGALQELLHDGGNAVPEKEVQQTANAALSRMELFHVFSCYFSYIAGHIGHLEAIESSEPAETSSPSFVEAMRFGITLSSFPSYPMYATEVDAYEPGGPRYPLRSSLHECLLLIGYLSLDDRLLQEMLSWGTEKTLLGTIISTLPIHYFTKGRHILFPTFVCALTESYKNNLVARHEMDLRQLLTFVEDEYNLLSKKAKSFALEHASQLKSHKARTDPQHFSLMSSVGKSWADMTDDEEEQSETAPVADAPTTTPSTEKERLCKSLKTVAGSGNDVFYRVERRIPVAYWPGVIAQLQQTLKSTAH